jgi:hypothetical protein
VNLALPAIIVFLLLLPGFILRARLKRVERTSLDFSPFGQVVVEAVLWALLAHSLWLLFSYFIFDRVLLTTEFLKLLSADTRAQATAIEATDRSGGWVGAYFLTIFLASTIVPNVGRNLVTRFRLDRGGAKLGRFFRFHHAPWYYLLTGADFDKEKEPDLILISAIVEVAGNAYIYSGVLDGYLVNSEGQLDRLVLQQAMRRSMESDKKLERPLAWPVAMRFYPIDGDYFVLRYSEAITLNVEYIRLSVMDAAPQKQSTLW